MATRPALRAVLLALATAGLPLTASCAGGTTSPTPQPAPLPTPVSPDTSSPASLLWPLAGRDGRDWVINNYVDVDATGGVEDYTGGRGSGARTYDGHNGIDIDIPNFRWMDAGLSNVFAAAGGVVTAVRDTEPDRNTSCSGNANIVQVRHADGLIALYGHLKKGSAVVSAGQEVAAGAVLGVVGSSGCSTAPHLHFELRDAGHRVVDPFRKGLWADPPVYNTPVTLMDLVTTNGEMTFQQIKDPAPNVQSMPRGTVLSVGISMAGGGAGDQIRMVITDPAGATFSDNPVTFTTAQRHSYWLWNRQLSPTPGLWTVSIVVNGARVLTETLVAN